MKKLRSYLIITLGALLLTAGVYFFKFPNHFTTGGVSALSIIFGFVTDAISPGTFVFIINAALLVVGFIVLGGSFGIKTVYASLLFSVGTMVLEKVVPLDAYRPTAVGAVFLGNAARRRLRAYVQ